MKYLKVNSEISFYGKKYFVISKNALEVKLLSKVDNSIIDINFQALVNDPTFDDGVSVDEYNGPGKYKSILSTLNDKERDIITKRFEIIRPILALEDAKSMDLNIQDVCKEYLKPYIEESETIDKLTQKKLIERISRAENISTRSIARYLASFRDIEIKVPGFGQEGLITKSGIGYKFRKDNKSIDISYSNGKNQIVFSINTRLDELYIPIIKESIEKMYLTKIKNSNIAVWDYINIQCTKLSIETPTKITIYKMLNRIDDKIKDITREGKKIAQLYDDIERGFTNVEALYPLHIVAIDHTELDLMVIDDNTGYVIGRPWITLGIDLFSRCVWCMHVSFEPPSINKVRKALQHGMFFKYVKDTYYLENEWEVFGFPDNILFDNGTDFKSGEVQRIINETMRSNVMYRPVRTPRYGAVIERYFGTLNSKLIHRLEGTTKSSHTQLGDYEPEKEATLTLKDIIELLTRFIVDEYHYSKHKGLPLNSNIPMVRYKEYYNERGYVSKSEEEKYSLELLPQVIRPYTRDGIRLENVRYKSKEISYLIGKREKKYKIKYDPDDISKVYLLIPDSLEYVEVPAVEPSYETLVGVNLYTYKKLNKELINEGILKSRCIPGTQTVEKAKVKRQERYEQMIRKNKGLLKQAKRENVQLTVTYPDNIKDESNKNGQNLSIKVLAEMAKAKAKARDKKKKDGTSIE